MINGVINVYKEKGFTSHDVVAKLRGILRQKKIGHTGTLDPDATSVLPVCLGNATKLCDMFTEKTKTYKCVLLLGVETDTEDITGEIINKADDSVIMNLTEKEVTDVIRSFEGDYEQIPPMYSALKVDGVKLYDLARQGITIERKSRKVTLSEIKILSVSLPEVVIEVSCSKGTYIRSLCRDIGEKLGCGGCMKELVRTRSGHFYIEESLTLGEIEELVQKDEFISKVITTEDALKIYPKIITKKGSDKLLHNGNPLSFKDVTEQGEKEDNSVFEGNLDNNIFRTYDSEGTFLGLYKKDEAKMVYKNEKMFL